MILGQSSSRWQTVIADLSLILFLVAASAIGDDAASEPGAQAGDSVSLSIWRAGAAAPPLSEWLAESAPDDSQRLAITITYGQGGLAGAIAEAETIRRAAGAAGADALLEIVPGARPATQVRLVQNDRPEKTGPDVAS